MLCVGELWCCVLLSVVGAVCLSGCQYCLCVSDDLCIANDEFLKGLIHIYLSTINTVVSDNATVKCVLTVVRTLPHHANVSTTHEPTVPMVGGVIPPDAVLVFDILLLDIWSSDDKVQISTISKPANCKRTVEASDYVRYHYNGSLLSGTYFDTRWVNFLFGISEPLSRDFA